MSPRVTPRPRIGCSGWNYKSWRSRFYPDRMPAAAWLRHYATRFDTVEANGTFYRLPERETFVSWREQTPSSFLMAVKASRFLTHMKRLREPEEPLERLLSRAAALGTRLGPVLYQLPPQFHCNLERLDTFLAALPRRYAGRSLLHVMEFRHKSWYVDEVFQTLAQHQVALCLHDKVGSEITGPIVGPFVYVRFHGATGDYHGSYTTRDLSRWAARLIEQWQDGRAVFAYFNNDPDAVATQNASALLQLIARRTAA